jgi:hypothetical protein
LALKYLRKLDNNFWQSHYDLSLRVFREISNVELSLGNFDSGNELGQQVIEHARDLDDKLPTYLALAVAKGRQHKHAESFILCQEALFRLKAIPRRMHFIRMLKDIQVVKRLLKKYSDYDILMLPICQDLTKATIMDFLTEYCSRSYQSGNPNEFLYGVVRKLRISFKYGLARGSAHALACFGLYLLVEENDSEGALRMARLAREIMNRMERHSNSTNSLTLLTIAHFIEAWSFSREHVMETLQQAHHTGMASGNIEVGFLNWAVCNIFAHNSGYPLEPIERAGSELIHQLRIYHVDSVLAIMSEAQLPITYLLGKKELDWNELEPIDMYDDKSELYRNVFGYLSRLEIGVYFGNLEFAARMSDLIQPHIKADGSYVGVSKEHFYSSLAYVGLARETRIRKYQKKATRIVRKLRHLCRTRGLNVLHKCLLLEAEILSLRSDYVTATPQFENVAKLVKAYDMAISAATEIGYIQDAAFGSELAGGMMLAIGEDRRGYEYLNQSRDLWREHGAHAKVKGLVEKYGRKLDVSGINTTETIGDILYGSVEFSEPRKVLDLDLLTGSGMKTKIATEPLQSSASSLKEGERDEVSILSEPSGCLTSGSTTRV